MPTTTILLGASVRAAAYSALRAGLTPWCIDLFADADLRAIAPVQRCSISDYPGGMTDLLREAPVGPVLFTGGLENYPRVIERIAAERPVWGNTADALRQCRDPFYVAQIYRAAGIEHPKVVSNWEDVESGGSVPRGRYLRKPLSGAGGAHIAPAEPGLAHSAACYLQQFIDGSSCSAVYCAFADRVELLGVTEQLIGQDWLHARPFHYCGSIGPIDPGSHCTKALLRIGEVLRNGCDLRGLFGVDFILHEDEPWPIEVNPRYTASIEVLEHATGIQALAWHRLAFEQDPHYPELPLRGKGDGEDQSSQYGNRMECRVVGKAILFAPRILKVPDSGSWPITIDPFELPDCADLPNAGETIEAGGPILTLFAAAVSVRDCRVNLQHRAGQIESALFPGVPRTCRTVGRT